MEWYALESLDKAFSRSKRALFEPFELWKWVRLAFIIILAGSGAGFNGSGGNGGGGTDISDLQVQDMPFADTISYNAILDQLSLPGISLAVVTIVLIIGLIVLFQYLASLMDFTLVESLVRNDVRVLEYSGRFLSQGFRLFLLRLGISLLFLSILALAALPLIVQVVNGTYDEFWPMMIAGVLSLLTLIFIIAIISSIVNSLINLSIPVVLYQEKGILESFRTVLSLAMKDWQQMLVYWLGRAILWGAGSIIIAIALLIILFIPFVFFVLIDVMIYFGVEFISTSSQLPWLVLAPFIILEVLFLILAGILGKVPLGVFMKYHMLGSLEMWKKDLVIPFRE